MINQPFNELTQYPTNFLQLPQIIQLLETIIIIIFLTTIIPMQKRSQRSQLYKIKKHKDFSFLLDIKADQVNEFIVKYLLEEGKGQTIGDIKVPVTVYYTYKKYDYTGKFMERVENRSISLPLVTKPDDNEENRLGQSIMTMRVSQKSWFNSQLYAKYSTTCGGYPGYHYELTLDKFVYKNDNNFQSKFLIYEENRLKAREEFLKKNYKEAVKIYKYSINILKGLSRKFFTPEEMKKLKEFLDKSEENFLKCVAKMNGFGGRLDKEIAKQAKQICETYMKKHPDSIHSYYKKAIYLKYECFFSDAEDAIKEGLKKKFSEVPEEAEMEKASLLRMLSEIKLAKERNVRHLHREELRKKINERVNRHVWDGDDEQEGKDDDWN